MPEPVSEAPEPAESARARLWRAVVRPARGQAVVAVLLALLGFAAVTQVRTNTVDDTYAGLRQQDLIDVLDGLAGTTLRSQNEITRLETARDELQSDTSAREAAIEQARSQADVLSVLAGTVPVRGPGIEIRIQEGPEAGVRVGAFIDLVQALRTAGAEAISFNDTVRVIAQTSFDSAVGGLLVDGEVLDPPFTVAAIGNSDALVAALRFPDGPQDQFAADGAELTFEEQATVQIETIAQAAPADLAQAQQ